jgi:hypothetical protein
VSDTAIKLIAFCCWPLIVALFAAVMLLGLVVIVLAWPVVPFMRVDRSEGKTRLKL